VHALTILAARSGWRTGSKQFLNSIKESGATASSASDNIIGQFGVGFYSAFMVADQITVYSRPAVGDGPGTAVGAWAARLVRVCGHSY